MRIRLKVIFLLLAVVTAMWSVPAISEEETVITVRFRSEAWFYSQEGLMDLSEPAFMNLRGTHKKPVVEFTDLIFGQTGVNPDDVEMILVFRHSGSPVILRGAALEQLGNLVVTGGEEKVSGEPHVWALAPKDDAAYNALKKELGSLRKREMYRVDIHPKVRTLE